MDKQYDVAIIGSGLSGLVCAYILSKEGYKVCVLEKNQQVGGCLQTFSRDKCIFDVGVHYLGGLSAGQNLHQYFKYFGIMDQLNIELMNEDAFEIITFEGDDTEYKYAQGYKRFSENLIEQFPKEKVAILKYCQLMQEYCNLFPLYDLNINKAYPSNFKHLEASAEAVISSLTDDLKLRAVLAGTNMLYAGNSQKTPFYVHALVVNSYIQSAWRCVDGGSQIAKYLVKNIRANGGAIFKRAEVTKLLLNSKNIHAVEVNGTTEIASKYVISSIHPQTLLTLVGEKGMRKAYQNRINSLSDTVSVFSAHYTLNKNTVAYDDRNYYHLKGNNAWTTIHHTDKNWPLHYLALTPRTSKSKDYAESMTIMAYMHYSEVEKWGDSFNTVVQQEKRSAAYEDFKAQKMERLLEEIYKKFPTAKGNVKGSYASTPLSFRDYIGSPTGSLYGIERSYQDPLLTSISTKTRIKNLFLTGQNVNMHGVLGVTVSAILTCTNFVDRQKLLQDIVNA